MRFGEQIWISRFEKINEICFFDRLKSICEGDCYNLDMLSRLGLWRKAPPIEKKLKLVKAGLSFEPQVNWSLHC